MASASISAPDVLERLKHAVRGQYTGDAARRLDFVTGVEQAAAKPASASAAGDDPGGGGGMVAPAGDPS